MADNTGEKSSRPKIQPRLRVSRQPLQEVGAAVEVDQNGFPSDSKNGITFICRLCKEEDDLVTLILVSTPGGIINTFLYLKWNEQKTGDCDF